MKIILILFFTMTIYNCGKFDFEKYMRIKSDEDELINVAKEAASLFDYYDEISPNVPNVIVGQSEIGGQCGDYALAFVNKWNEKYPNEALLVIQQQGFKQFPDGLYKVIEKDNRNLLFLNNRTTSMLYVWFYIKGIGHPQLGGYKISLVKRLHIISHFDFPDWGKNGPHVWVWVGNTSIDPTYADIGTLPIIGKDKW